MIRIKLERASESLLCLSSGTRSYSIFWVLYFVDSETPILFPGTSQTSTLVPAKSIASLYRNCNRFKRHMPTEYRLFERHNIYKDSTYQPIPVWLTHIRYVYLYSLIHYFTYSFGIFCRN